MIGWFKKKRKEESAMTEDEKQEAKAKENIAEKGADSQTEKDRIDDARGERREDIPKWAERMIESLDRIVSYFEDKAKGDPDAKAAEKLDAAFGAGDGVFQGEGEHEAKKMSKEEIASLVHKVMR